MTVVVSRRWLRWNFELTSDSSDTLLGKEGSIMARGPRLGFRNEHDAKDAAYWIVETISEYGVTYRTNQT